MRSTLLKLGLLCAFFLVLTPSAFSQQRVGRLGLGISNQAELNNLPSLSFKLQRSRTIAYGATVALKSNSSSTAYAVGLKLYKLIFLEENLNFYASLYGAIMNDNTIGKISADYQVDATLGSEFSFQGLKSIGFSFELGLSINDEGGETTFEVLGNNFLKAAVHFYL